MRTAITDCRYCRHPNVRGVEYTREELLADVGLQQRLRKAAGNNSYYNVTLAPLWSNYAGAIRIYLCPACHGPFLEKAR